MGLFDSVKKAWSGADFWDKQENAQQKVAFAQEDERKKREREILAKQRADAAAKLAVERTRRQQTLIPTKPEVNQASIPLAQRPKTGMPIPSVALRLRLIGQ